MTSFLATERRRERLLAQRHPRLAGLISTAIGFGLLAMFRAPGVIGDLARLMTFGVVAAVVGTLAYWVWSGRRQRAAALAEFYRRQDDKRPDAYRTELGYGDAMLNSDTEDPAWPAPRPRA